MTPFPAYAAPAWLPGGHLQTVYTHLFVRVPRVHYRRERLELADGDFLYYRLLEIADVELWVRSVEELFASRPSFDQRSYCADLAGSGSTSSLSQ